MTEYHLLKIEKTDKFLDLITDSKESCLIEVFVTSIEKIINQMKNIFVLHYKNNNKKLKPITKNILFNSIENNNPPGIWDEISRKISTSIITQIFCYQLIKNKLHFHNGVDIPDLPTESSTNMLKLIENCFNELISLFEFAPIFNFNNLFRDLHNNKEFIQILSDLIIKIKQLNFSKLDNDFISGFFQSLIPYNDKKNLGQIYTPNHIAKFMSRLSISSSSDCILDPACGCGIILKNAYLQLQTFNPKPKTKQSSSNLLQQIWGVEINPFPAQITMMNLALMSLTEIIPTVGVFIEDFLDLGPLQKYMVKTKNLITGKTQSLEMPHKFDVIIANPPYIKQERIPNKREMMEKLPIYASYREKGIYSKNHKRIYKPVKLRLSAKTDYYGFFLWYSYYFLKDRGKMCFIIPDKWMDVKYGEKIKDFLLNHFQINAIIGFKQNVFIDAQVSTIILYITKEPNENKRKNHISRFYNLKTSRIPKDFHEIINSPLPTSIKMKLSNSDYDFDQSSDKYTCTCIYQKYLLTTEKWTYKYLFQSQFSMLLQSKSLISLHNRISTSVIGGIKTGANKFFFPSEEDISRFNIEPRFLIPGIKSGRNLPNGYFVSESINDFLYIPPTTSIENYSGLKEFIKFGHYEKKYPQRPSIHWDPWYSIPKKSQDSPDIVFLRHIDEKFVAKWNKVHCVVADGIRGIQVHDSKDIIFYLGILNSTFFYWQAHVQGRWEGQGDLQLLVYELKRFQIPDISQLNSNQVQAVKDAMIELMKFRQKTCFNWNSKNHSAVNLQKTLDLAVLSTMGLERQYDLLINEVHWLEEKRLNKKYKA